MFKLLKYFFLFALIAFGLSTYLLFKSNTHFNADKKYFIIKKGTTAKNLCTQLHQEKIITNPTLLLYAGKVLQAFNNLKPGKYEVKKGTNLITLIKMLRNGKQAAIKLVINKLRTNEDFAKLIGKNFSTDSATVMHFITHTDSLQDFKVDSSTFFTIIHPNTYTFYYNTPLKKIITTLYQQSLNFWQGNNRLAAAQKLGLTKEQVYTLASIVEEESNYNDDRTNIASVYLNRLKKGMPLQADPTVKFALKDFTLKRIYHKHLAYNSPYNTYKVKGLPPGPICTPSAKCIDIVLNAPATNYLYFVAKPNFDGRHMFAETYQQHLIYAKAYQQALDQYYKNKNPNN
jgi:UPF0755 protein